MRIAAKATLYVGTGYLITVCVLAVVLQQRVSAREAEVARRAANLVGQEIGAALSQASLTRILRADAPSRTHLHRLIDGLTQDSSLLASIVVVNQVGTVVASDSLPVGTRAPLPDDVFGQVPEIRYAREAIGHPAGSSDGRHTVLVPLLRADRLAGYLQLTLADSGLEGLYRDAYRELLAGALLGLLFVGGLGFALHRELRQRGHSLTRALEAIRLGRAWEPEAALGRDEFSGALEAAGTLGRELDRMRRAGELSGPSMKSPAVLDDLTSATRLRTLAQIYRALAHELRAPLGAMSLHLDALRERLGEGDVNEDGPQRDVETLAKELRRLDHSLRAVLAETAPDAEGPSEFDLRALVLEVEELLAPQGRHQGVKIETNLPAAAVRVHGARDRLKQALLNVVMNAFEVQPGGGTVAMAVAPGPDPGSVTLRVEDAGPGIPVCERERVFDLHYSTRSGGTGIGLTVARAVVEAAGGTMEIGDAPRGGASIAMILPQARRRA